MNTVYGYEVGSKLYAYQSEKSREPREESVSVGIVAASSSSPWFFIYWLIVSSIVRGIGVEVE